MRTFLESEIHGSDKKMKEKIVMYLIFAIFYLFSRVILLIWSVKTGGAKESILPLLMLLCFTGVCAILSSLDFKGK